jgi:alpha-glucoside transport system permease protein
VLRALGRAPIHVLLVVVGLLWLVPTFGLLITSLIAPEDFAQGGWWRVFSQPSLLTFENYQSIWDTQAIRDSLLTTVWISIGGTLLPILVAALAGYAFAWLEFPGRDWAFIGVVALLVVPLQMALIPIFSLYNKVGIFDTVISLILFHTAFGLPFAIFLLRNFFIGIPEGAPRSGADRRRLGDAHLRQLILPLGLPAIASLAIFQFLWTWNDLLVALTFGRQTQPITVAIFSAAPPVRLEHRADRAGLVRLARHSARRVSSRSSATSCRGSSPAR